MSYSGCSLGSYEGDESCPAGGAAGSAIYVRSSVGPCQLGAAARGAEKD